MIQEYKEKSELEELVVLIREVWREYYTPLIGAAQVEYMLEKFQSVDAILRQIAEEHYRYFCIFCDGEPAGYYASKPCDGSPCPLPGDEGKGSVATGKRVFLSKLYVAAKFRGRGLGKQMLQHLIDAARADGATTIWLTVNKHNRSVDIYRKLGFVITEEIVTDIGNGFVMDDYVMEKYLSCETLRLGDRG